MPILQFKHHVNYVANYPNLTSATFSGSLDLKTVCNELEVVKHKEYEIGIQLGVPNSKMLVFKKEGGLLLAAVGYWLSGNIPSVPITWESLVTALKSEQVGESGCAETICKKYCCQQEKSGDIKNQLDMNQG